MRKYAQRPWERRLPERSVIGSRGALCRVPSVRMGPRPVAGRVRAFAPASEHQRAQRRSGVRGYCRASRMRRVDPPAHWKVVWRGGSSYWRSSGRSARRVGFAGGPSSIPGWLSFWTVSWDSESVAATWPRSWCERPLAVQLSATRIAAKHDVLAEELQLLVSRFFIQSQADLQQEQNQQ